MERSKGQDKYFFISLRIANKMYNKHIFLSFVIIFLNKSKNTGYCFLEKVQTWGMHTLERQGKTQTHSHLLLNVCLLPEEKSTKPLTLTGG